LRLSAGVYALLLDVVCMIVRVGLVQ